jgi:hypothetical protein
MWRMLGSSTFSRHEDVQEVVFDVQGNFAADRRTLKFRCKVSYPERLRYP